MAGNAAVIEVKHLGVAMRGIIAVIIMKAVAQMVVPAAAAVVVVQAIVLAAAEEVVVNPGHAVALKVAKRLVVSLFPVMSALLTAIVALPAVIISLLYRSRAAALTNAMPNILV